MAENKTKFYNWQKAVATDFIKFRKESPNLLAIKDYLCKRWGGSNVGILNKRPIRGGSSPSSHTFGAALDWRYGDTVGHRHKIEAEVLPWLIEHSEELGIQAIHDYYGCRVWRSVREVGKRGWKAQPPKSEGGAMGEAWAKWLHIETTKESWRNRTRVDERIS
jgi:hypothetical protein